MSKNTLYELQEDVLSRLQRMGSPAFNEAKLCGGTALSRCWLDHRISYDLEFFLPHGFNAQEMAVALKKSGIAFEVNDIVDHPRKANQLHGHVIADSQTLKVSFIEDAYFTLYPAVLKEFGKLVMRTEEIPGLYHRKLRTVSGGGSQGDSFEGGRQTARDLFDLYVLSEQYMPLQEFMQSMPYSYNCEAFINGIVNMPWFDLMDELKEINCHEKWTKAKDVELLQNALFEQLGAATYESPPESVRNGQTP
jgi:hypothetical protein